MSGVDENMELLELSQTAHANIKWYSHFGKQIGNFLKSKTYTYYLTKPFHF